MAWFCPHHGRQERVFQLAEEYGVPSALPVEEPKMKQWCCSKCGPLKKVWQEAKEISYAKYEFLADDRKLMQVEEIYPHNSVDSRRIGKPFCPHCGRTVRWKEVKTHESSSSEIGPRGQGSGGRLRDHGGGSA
jgi:hypothetical protein